MPRSGTTLVEQIIASHPQVYGAGELPDIRRTGQQKLRFGSSDPERYCNTVSGLKAADIAGHAEDYLSALRRCSKSANLVSDKNPHNYEQLAFIALMFPNAHVVHCVRDPMDTCTSCFMHNFEISHGYNADLLTLGQYYREYYDLMAHWRSVLPLKMIDVRYEDLIADQEGTTRNLIQFLDLEWDAACLAFFETDRQVKTPSRWQVRQPIYGSSVKSWKRYEQHLDPLKRGLGDLFVE